MLRRSFIALILAVLSMPALAVDSHAGDKRPNIVFILADDLGWTDLGCYGSKYYETPHLDRLAKNGLRLTSGYSAGPNCTPTRAALITGQYGPRTGMYTVGTGARGDAKARKLTPVDNVLNLPERFRTVAQAMKGQGYATGLFGKWHLGNGKGFHPADRGFDEAIVSMGKHFDFVTNPKLPVDKDAYLADYLTDKACDFIQRHKDKPFFLYLPHFGVHSPFQAKKELIERFQKKTGVGGHSDPTYAAMIASVDESVGRVIALLEKLKLAENTLVIFSSDNGGVGGYLEAGIKGGGGITNNAPLRGGKGMLYEGGVRVVWIMAWPGRIPPGRTSDEPVISVDLFPTCVELAGGRLKAGETLDGVSITPLFNADPKVDLKRDAVFWHFPGYLEAGKGKNWRTTPAGAIRAGDWKLQEYFEDGRLELYNLRDDLSQRTELSRMMPEKTRELHEKLKAWRSAVKAPMPTNP